MIVPKITYQPEPPNRTTKELLKFILNLFNALDKLFSSDKKKGIPAKNTEIQFADNKHIHAKTRWF